MGRINKLLFVLVAVSLLILAVQPVGAQTTKGSISGVVVDQSGAAVPQATVTVTNRATGEKASVTTSDEGSFRFNLLTIGSYEVEISKHGFKKLKLTSVSVDPSVDHGLGTLKLELGEMTSTVEVSAAAPLMETSQAQVTTSISGERLAYFPGIGENQGLDNLALQVPGVVASRDANFSNSNGGGGFSVNGIRGRNNDQQIDGQNNNDNSVAGPGLFLANIDFVQEYQLTTNNFGPEYGRNSGSVVNVVTRGGTNTWHGTVSATYSNNNMTALNNEQIFFQGLTKVPKFNNEFTGGTIGGPLWKNHVFIFGGFDDNIIASNGVFQSSGWTPTPVGLGQLAACYPGSPSVAALAAHGAYGIGGGDPTPVASGLSTVNLSSNTGVANACHVEVAPVQRALPNPTHIYDWVYKTDVVISQSDRFSGRYLYQKENFVNGGNSSSANAGGYPLSVPSLSQSFLLDWSHTVSTRMLNELRLSFSRLNVDFGTNTVGNTIPSQGQLTSALASIAISSTGGLPMQGWGPATNLPQGRIVNTYQLQDNWNFSQGRHNWKAGVNFTYQRSPNIFFPNINGSFTFSTVNATAATGPIANGICSLPVGSSLNPLSAYGCDIPTSIGIGLGNPSLDFREYDTFLYAGDDWKIKDNLTLNLGLTWSYYGQPANLFHDRTTKQQSSSTPFWNPALPTSVTTFPSIPSPKTSFGPSIGFAWTPSGGWLTGNGKTVVRGGYRLSYDPPFYNIYLNIASSAPVVIAQTITGANARANGITANPTGPVNRAQLAPFLVTGVSDPRGFSQTTITPDFGPDYVHSWSLGIQRQIVNSAVFEARYVGNKGENLFQSINANPNIAGLAAGFPALVPSGVTPCPAAQAVVPTAVGRINCALGVQRKRTNTGYSDYNAIQTELRTTNLWNQLSMRTGYTWSKTTDNVTEIFGTFAGGNSIAFSQNPLNFKGAEHALSGLDIPQSWTIGFVEDIPFLRAQHGVIGHILGGWALSGSYIMASGQHYTPSQVNINRFSGGVANDAAFNAAFNSSVDTSRPFWGTPSAPATQVGVFAGDACAYLGVGCAVTPTQLISMNDANSTGTVTNVTKAQVRYIVNGGTADGVFGTPFGNVPRNAGVDGISNVGNFTLFKNIKFNERALLQFHMTMTNVFNHVSYGSLPGNSGIDPFLEDAGVFGDQSGFGDPSVFPSSSRQFYFGLKVTF
jgi:hypothetical protein